MISIPTGELALHQTDFSLNSPIPFNWTRNYFTHIERNTLLGKIWHFCYDQAIKIDLAEDSFFGQTQTVTN